MKKNIDYVGTEQGYHVYMNSDGFLEGYKKIGKSKYGSPDQGSDVKRVVSNQTTIEGFGKYVRGLCKTKNFKPDPGPKIEFP